MATPLRDHLPEIAARVAGAPSLLVLLDYDGTLTPIVDRPEDAVLDPHMREAVAALARRPDTTVAVISGRALEDVRAHVSIDGLIYAGNHGLEIRGPGIAFACPEAVARRGELYDLAGELARRFRRIPGVRVEDKCLTLSIHYRLVPENELPEFRAVLDGVLATLRPCFRLTTGNKVYEIRPRVDWNKGIASTWIRRRLGGPDVLPVYVGDDQTDEDAFAALRNGVTVRVGAAARTAANYSLPDPAGVCRFLGWLAASGKG